MQHESQPMRPSKKKLVAKVQARGKAALVTGSAKRLGKAIAMRLAADGYFTYVHYLGSKAEAEATLATIQAAGGQGALVRGDVSKPASVQAMAKTVAKITGRLDVIVQNVGLYRTGPLLDTPVNDLANLFASNTFSTVSLMQACLPLFPQAGGSFVAIGYSGLGAITGTDHNAAYLASKTALLCLVKSLALEVAPRHIRVNMVSPGIMSNSVELPRKIGDFAAMGRLGEPEEVASAVSYLAGDGSSYVTGVNLDVAGGYMLEPHTLKAKDLRKAKT
jgi:3-oxoacyl-[acyl-carrier protein] reductase